MNSMNSKLNEIEQIENEINLNKSLVIFHKGNKKVLDKADEYGVNSYEERFICHERAHIKMHLDDLKTLEPELHKLYKQLRKIIQDDVVARSMLEPYFLVYGFTFSQLLDPIFLLFSDVGVYVVPILSTVLFFKKQWQSIVFEIEGPPSTMDPSKDQNKQKPPLGSGN